MGTIDVELEMTCSMCLTFKVRSRVTDADELDRANILIIGAMTTHAESVHAVYALPRT